MGSVPAVGRVCRGRGLAGWNTAMPWAQVGKRVSKAPGAIGRWVAGGASGLLLVVGACGGGSAPPPTPTVPPTLAQAPTPRRPPLDTPGTSATGTVLPSVVHTVAPGDTLAEIALRYYRDASRWQRIYEANRAAIPDPSALAVGTRLTIPPP